MEDLYFDTISYDLGVNSDKWETWRNDGDIGYVHLAFKVISEAMYDLVLGEADDHLSASYFFFGNEEESLYKFWARIIGLDEDKLPLLVMKYKRGHVTQKDMEYIRNLCTTMKTI
jgi:hypothetical protein